MITSLVTLLVFALVMYLIYFIVGKFIGGTPLQIIGIVLGLILLVKGLTLFGVNIGL